MIDFTTIPMHEPLPEVSTLKYQNNGLVDENKALKKTVQFLVVGIFILIGIQLYKSRIRRLQKEEY
jgi:hypothetical protein